MLGLLAIAEGDRESAIMQLEKSVELPYTNLDHCWGEAFLERLKQPNSSWPRGNPNMVNSER